MRRDKKLYCYNEAISDTYSVPKKKLKWDSNHHFLDEDDDKEILTAIKYIGRLYPEFPSFRDYMKVTEELRVYFSSLVEFSKIRQRRPVFCEIYSRCRAPDLRRLYGGFHVTQYRDPLSQFGSYVRALEDGGEWGFLCFPLYELGINGKSPLYDFDHEIPVLPWPKDWMRRWISSVEYMTMAGRSSPRQLLKWHLYSWYLGNLMVMSVSDLIIDIDKLHDNTDYRETIVKEFWRRAIKVEFNDIRKYQRYYEFSKCNIEELCEEVSESIEERFSELKKHYDLKYSHLEMLNEKLANSLDDYKVNPHSKFSITPINPVLSNTGRFLRSVRP